MPKLSDLIVTGVLAGIALLLTGALALTGHPIPAEVASADLVLIGGVVGLARGGQTVTQVPTPTSTPVDATPPGLA